MGIALNTCTVPPCIVALLVATGVPPFTAWDALIGTPQLCPLHVLIVFFGMAYICISLDGTGLLRHIALQAASRTGSPLSVFFAVTSITCILTLLTSNDIVILTLTPIIAYLCEAKGYDPYPFLYLEFVTANVWSIALMIGNPTNMIVAEAADLSFSVYFDKMAPVGLASGVAAVGAIYVLFHSGLRVASPAAGALAAEKVETSTGVALHPIRAWVCTTRLVVLLVFAALDSFTRVPLWESVGVTCAASLAMDVVLDLKEVDGVTSSCQRALKTLPWSVPPFVLSLFFMVEVLDNAGVVSAIAREASAAIGSSRLGASFGIGMASIIACQFLNNQPMTVLFAKVLINPYFDVEQDVSDLAHRALIVGSNLGANVTLIGALAGPLWVGLLKQHALEMDQVKFMRAMACITPPIAFVAFVTVVLT